MTITDILRDYETRTDMEKKTIEIPEGYEARIEGNKVFLEPKESENERIIGRIKKAVESYWSDEPLDEILSWLEKQGGQKSAWSEEDKRNLEGIIDEIEANKNNAPDYDIATYDRFLSWLKSLKSRVLPSQWKPSDEQMRAFYKYLNEGDKTLTLGESLLLRQLYNDLKKLKG